MRDEVEVPVGMRRPATLRGDDDIVVALTPEDERRRVLRPRLAPARREQEDRRALAPDVADLAVGLDIAADVLVAEEVVIAHVRSRRRQSRHLRSFVSSVEPTLISAPGAGKAGTSAPF